MIGFRVDSVGELVDHARHYDFGVRLVCRSCGYQPQNFGIETISAAQHARHAGSVTYDFGVCLVCRSCGYQPQNFGIETISAEIP